MSSLAQMQSSSLVAVFCHWQACWAQPVQLLHHRSQISPQAEHYASLDCTNAPCCWPHLEHRVGDRCQGGICSQPPYLSPEPWGPRVSSVMFHGEPAHPVYLQGMFLSRHLHNPCFCTRGHDLSDNDNITGSWLSGIHGQVVAHIRKDIGLVVPLYVLTVAIRGASIHETNTLNQEEETQKRRRLDGDAMRWEHYLTASDKLAREHAQRAHDAYCSAHASEVTWRHLCELRTLCTNTQTAKQNTTCSWQT